MSLAAHSLHHALRTDRAATLAALYQRAFPLVRRYVRRHGGADADAEDIFQDAFVLVFEKAVAGTLTLTGPPGHYLFGVSRHLWQRELTRRRRLPTEALTPGLTAQAAEVLPEPELPSLLDHLAKLGERCRRVLTAFYYFREPLEQIAATHQYASVRSATVQKYKCLERLRGAVRAALHDKQTTLT